MMQELAAGQERLFEVPEETKKHNLLKKMKTADDNLQSGKLKMEVLIGSAFVSKMEVGLDSFKEFAVWVKDGLDDDLKGDGFVINKFKVTGEI